MILFLPIKFSYNGYSKEMLYILIFLVYHMLQFHTFASDNKK